MLLRLLLIAAAPKENQASQRRPQTARRCTDRPAVGWLAGWLAGWLIGWLAGWADRLAGWDRGWLA